METLSYNWKDANKGQKQMWHPDDLPSREINSQKTSQKSATWHSDEGSLGTGFIARKRCFHRDLNVFFFKEFENLSCEEISDISLISKKRRLYRDANIEANAKYEDFSLERQFMELAKNWKHETAMFSTAHEKITNPNYMAIIGMGIMYKKEITKLILEDLQEGADFWHFALKSITQENPVPKGMVNNLRVVRECWLKWGADQQII